jgi:hypothetical protein
VDHLLVNDVERALALPASPTGLACESQLRVAAATLRRSATTDVKATTAVGVLGADDTQSFEALVASIADEYGLRARVRLGVGSFSVRFTRA